MTTGPPAVLACCAALAACGQAGDDVAAAPDWVEGARRAAGELGAPDIEHAVCRRLHDATMECIPLSFQPPKNRPIVGPRALPVPRTRGCQLQQLRLSITILIDNPVANSCFD